MRLQSDVLWGEEKKYRLHLKVQTNLTLSYTGCCLDCESKSQCHCCYFTLKLNLKKTMNQVVYKKERLHNCYNTDPLLI